MRLGWWSPWDRGMGALRAQLPPGQRRSSDPAAFIHDPNVAPDQSFIVFDYGKVKGGLGWLCIAFCEGDHWSKSVDMGDEIRNDIPRGPHLAPDGKSVYYTGQLGIWGRSGSGREGSRRSDLALRQGAYPDQGKMHSDPVLARQVSHVRGNRRFSIAEFHAYPARFHPPKLARPGIMAGKLGAIPGGR